MKVKRFPSIAFGSNTYVVWPNDSRKVLLVDIGEYDSVRRFLKENESEVESLLLTHAHYDHIYYINELLRDFPNCKIYAHSYTIESLASPKLNLSFYHDDPVFYKGNNTVDIGEQSHLSFFDDLLVKVIPTPGHNPGCISYLILDCFFTGDSFIPGIPVVTKLKGGDRQKIGGALQK